MVKTLYYLIVDYIAIRWKIFHQKLCILPKELIMAINREWFLKYFEGHNLYNDVLDLFDIGVSLHYGYFPDKWQKIDKHRLQFHRDCENLAFKFEIFRDPYY